MLRVLLKKLSAGVMMPWRYSEGDPKEDMSARHATMKQVPDLIASSACCWSQKTHTMELCISRVVDSILSIWQAANVQNSRMAKG